METKKKRIHFYGSGCLDIGYTIYYYLYMYNMVNGWMINKIILTNEFGPLQIECKPKTLIYLLLFVCEAGLDVTDIITDRMDFFWLMERMQWGIPFSLL